MRAHRATASPGDRGSCSPRLCTWWALLSLALSLCAHVAAQVVPIHRTEGEIPACACGWPNIVNGLAAKEQLCPPPGIKCSMCMEGVHMIRHQKHPRSACAGFKQHEENVGFCTKLGDEMYELKHEIQNAVKLLSERYGPKFGASLEICGDLKCCGVGVPVALPCAAGPSSQPCLNGGSHFGDTPNCECRCTSGWEGVHCEKQIVTPCLDPNKPCVMGKDGKPCLNGGKPVGHGCDADCACECPATHTGLHCEELLVCSRGPDNKDCVQGTPVGTFPNCYCDCSTNPAWTGRWCEIEPPKDCTMDSVPCPPTVSTVFGKEPDCGCACKTGYVYVKPNQCEPNPPEKCTHGKDGHACGTNMVAFGNKPNCGCKCKDDRYQGNDCKEVLETCATAAHGQACHKEGTADVQGFLSASGATTNCKCVCKTSPAWAGTLCDKQIPPPPCTGPCGHHATPFGHQPHCGCKCDSGYAGNPPGAPCYVYPPTKCTTAVDGEPCESDGTEAIVGFMPLKNCACECKPGWKGVHCEDPCDPPCPPCTKACGANMEVYGNHPNCGCKCIDGFQPNGDGTACEIILVRCTTHANGKPCNSAGTTAVVGYLTADGSTKNCRCECKPEYTGTNCETSPPARCTKGEHGKDCSLINASPTGIEPDCFCRCKDGYQPTEDGTACEIQPKPCETTSKGHCSTAGTRAVVGYMPIKNCACECKPGFEGALCNDPFPPLVCTLGPGYQPCDASGTREISGIYPDNCKCICKAGYAGSHCQTPFPPQQCTTGPENKPCSNGGTPGGREPHCFCTCTEEFAGKWCDDPNICPQCPPGKMPTGKPPFCSCVPVRCTLHCENGGRPSSNTADCRCICPPGCTGPLCKTCSSTCITPCTSGPGGKNCQHGSPRGCHPSCSCECSDYYTGAHCEDVVSCRTGPSNKRCQNGGRPVGKPPNDCNCDCRTTSPLHRGQWCELPVYCKAGRDGKTCRNGGTPIGTYLNPPCSCDCATATVGCTGDWCEHCPCTHTCESNAHPVGFTPHCDKCQCNPGYEGPSPCTTGPPKDPCTTAADGQACNSDGTLRVYGVLTRTGSTENCGCECKPEGSVKHFTGNHCKCPALEKCTVGANGQTCQNDGTPSGFVKVPHLPDETPVCEQGSGCSCICPLEWSGPNCETSTECTGANDGGPCQNGGIPRGTQPDCLCECMGQFDGPHCEQKIDVPCKTGPEGKMCEYVAVVGEVPNKETKRITTGYPTGDEPTCTCTCPATNCFGGTHCETWKPGNKYDICGVKDCRGEIIENDPDPLSSDFTKRCCTEYCFIPPGCESRPAPTSDDREKCSAFSSQSTCEVCKLSFKETTVTFSNGHSRALLGASNTRQTNQKGGRKKQNAAGLAVLGLGVALVAGKGGKGGKPSPAPAPAPVPTPQCPQHGCRWVDYKKTQDAVKADPKIQSDVKHDPKLKKLAEQEAFLDVGFTFNFTKRSLNARFLQDLDVSGIEKGGKKCGKGKCSTSETILSKPGVCIPLCEAGDPVSPECKRVKFSKKGGLFGWHKTTRTHVECDGVVLNRKGTRKGGIFGHKKCYTETFDANGDLVSRTKSKKGGC